MIKSLSPYYVTTPFVNPLGGAVSGESYTLSIFIWNGLKASPPATAKWIITKTNPTSSTGSDKVNISRLINDFIEFAPQSSVTTATIDAANQWWVTTSVFYENDATVQQATTSLFSLGFSYGEQGENVTSISSNTLLSKPRMISGAIEYRADRNGVFTVPILVDESTTTEITAISYPDNEINFSVTEAATTTSSELVQIMWLNVYDTTTDTYIEVKRAGSLVATIRIKDEVKYTPIDVMFQNKEGAQETITFFKERVDRLNITKETYESDSGQPSSGNHQYKDYNFQGKRGFTINSGFVDESYNDVFNELMLSKRVYVFLSGVFTPINIKSSSLEYKTRQRNRLLNYSIDYEYSYNEINNV